MTDSEEISGATLYELLGGESAVRELVDRFFDLVAIDDTYAGIRKLYPSALDLPRNRLFWFLSGWLGGPPIYAEKIGPPMLRARHVPYSIGVEERDLWLTCMSQAMDEMGVDAELRSTLDKAFFGAADWMRNRPEK